MNAQPTRTGPSGRNPLHAALHRAARGGTVPGLAAGPLEYKSPIERLALATLILCHDVVALEAQPAESYEADGVVR